MSSEVKENELVTLDIRNQNVSVNNSEQNRNDKKKNCCCLGRLIQWYFEPMFPKIKYSYTIVLFHIIDYVIAWLAIGVDIMLLVSVGLFAAFCFGMVTFYISCELLLSLARLDLKIAIKMVEDNEVLKQRSQYLQRPLKFTMPSRELLCNRSCCPCLCVKAKNSEPKYNTISCCSLLYDRITTMLTTWRMYAIIIYYLVVKPVVTGFTSFMIILVFYAIYMILTPILYFPLRHLYDSGQVCGFGGSTCDNNGNNCHCYGLLINNFGIAFGVGILGFLMLPLALRIDNWAANLSKITTYYF